MFKRSKIDIIHLVNALNAVSKLSALLQIICKENVESHLIFLMVRGI